MHKRKSGMNDREDILLPTVLIPDILLATASITVSCAPSF
jgi:hypothetical protein